MDGARNVVSGLKKQGYVKPNCYCLHLCYFVLTIIISSVILYGSGVDGNSHNAEALFRLRYIDALFLCASAMTNTGLGTVNLSSITAFQQAVLAILILLGNITTLSVVTVFVRRHFFRKHMKNFLKHSEAGRRLVNVIDQEQGLANKGRIRKRELASSGLKQRKTDQRAQQSTKIATKHHENDQGGFPYPWKTRAFHGLVSKFGALGERVEHHYLSFQPSLDSKVIWCGHCVMLALLIVFRVVSTP